MITLAITRIRAVTAPEIPFLDFLVFRDMYALK
jgi:hypothetical protein